MSSQQFLFVSDADVAKATYELRTDRQRATDLGHAFMDGFRASGRLGKLNASPKLKIPARYLLAGMLFIHGEIEEMEGGLVGLTVRKPLKEVAVEMGWKPWGAYPAARLLEEAGLIERLKPGMQNESDQYAILARSSYRSAAQVARAKSDASDLDHTGNDRNPLPARVGARAKSDASDLDHTESPPRSSENPDKSGIPANGPDAAQAARAKSDADLTHNDHDDVNTSCEQGEMDRLERPDPPRVFPILRACGVDEAEARRRSKETSPLIATAIKVMIARRRLNRPGGFAVARLKDGCIDDSAILEARRLLAPKTPGQSPSIPAAPVVNIIELRANIQAQLAKLARKDVADA